MMLTIPAGTTSKMISFPIFDSSSTTGALKTSLTYSSMTGYYQRESAASATSITMATMTAGTWATGGFVVNDGTNMTGIYQLGVPNAAIATGAAWVMITLTATGIVPVVILIQLTSVTDYPANVTQMGGSALSTASAQIGVNVIQVGGTVQTAKDIGGAVPAAAAGASGGLLISGTNSGTTTLGALTVTGATTHTGNVSMAAGLTVTQSTSNGHGISVTGNGTGHGILSTSGSGATGDGIKAISAATAGNGITGAHNGSGVYDLNVTTTPVSLAKTTNITGFNDIAASAVVSSGAITTSGGAVSTVTSVTNAVTAGTISAGAVNNAAFNADVASTAYASNTLAQMMYKFFDNAFTGYSDGSTFTSNGLLDRLTKMMWIIRNQINVTDSNGNVTVLKDDNSTNAFNVSGMITDAAGTTTRLRAQ
jgi:hypothetical protein